MKRKKREYILYDARARGGVGTDNAIVFVACNSNKEAESYKGYYGAMACYSYAVEIGGDGKRMLMDEKWEWDYAD